MARSVIAWRTRRPFSVSTSSGDVRWSGLCLSSAKPQNDQIVGHSLHPLTGNTKAASGLGHGQRSIGDHAQQLPSRLRVPLSGSDHLT